MQSLHPPRPMPLTSCVYTYRMLRILLASFLLSISAAASLSLAQTQSAPLLPLGAVIPRVVAVQDPQQTYALYLPKRYSPETRWPVVYIFDPLARGELALRQFERAAELHGFIAAASNNSRNGPGAPQVAAAQAMVDDTQQRFSVDTKRIYFAGFSGGARVSSQLAMLCKCAAGVLLSGAGFPVRSRPSPDVKFAVFSAVGNADFNYSELIPLQEQLEKVALPSWLRIFDGPHEWPPADVMDEALAWFRVQAMKSNLEPRDNNFIAAQFTAANERASSQEKSGDLLSAWREYRQAAATFDLMDVAADRAKAESLAKDKVVRDALKRERAAFEEQSHLSDDVLSAASRPPDIGTNSDPSMPAQSAPQLARDLRQRSLAEKKPDRALIFKRALGGVFIGSIESGNAALERDNTLAAQYFACAAEANPESEWVFRQLAIARALSGDRKGAIEALRSARKLSNDLNAFSNWLDTESNLTSVRAMADFKTLRVN
jgi:predicted esterase